MNAVDAHRLDIVALFAPGSEHLDSTGLGLTAGGNQIARLYDSAIKACDAIDAGHQVDYESAKVFVGECRGI